MRLSSELQNVDSAFFYKQLRGCAKNWDKIRQT